MGCSLAFLGHEWCWGARLDVPCWHLSLSYPCPPGVFGSGRGALGVAAPSGRSGGWGGHCWEEQPPEALSGVVDVGSGVGKSEHAACGTEQWVFPSHLLQTPEMSLPRAGAWAPQGCLPSPTKAGPWPGPGGSPEMSPCSGVLSLHHFLLLLEAAWSWGWAQWVLGAHWQ